MKTYIPDKSPEALKALDEAIAKWEHISSCEPNTEVEEDLCALCEYHKYCLDCPLYWKQNERTCNHAFALYSLWYVTGRRKWLNYISIQTIKSQKYAKSLLNLLKEIKKDLT